MEILRQDSSTLIKDMTPILPKYPSQYINADNKNRDDDKSFTPILKNPIAFLFGNEKSIIL